MDLATQSRVLELTQDNDDLVVVLGAPDPESSELSALTLINGDPTFAGPLAGVQLGLPVFHILEDEVEAVSDATSYEENVSLMKLALDRSGIVDTMRRVRSEA